MSRLIKQIPDEWKARNFDEVFEFLPTLTLSRKDLNSDSEFDGIYNIHYGDIHSTYKFVELDFDKEKSIPKIIDDKIDESKLTFLTTGDLVIADASEDYEGVAACVELSNVKDRKVTAGLHTYAVRDKKGYSSEGFRAYILKHPWVNNEVNKIATGSKVYGISKTNISKLKVILPPLPEQQKIASILSKWDELIETQTQLIEEKEKQKKGLMQKLLTGEIRLPGFEEEWGIGVVKEYTDIKTGNSDTQDKVEDGKYPFFVRSQTIERINSFSFDGEAVLTSGDGVGVGKIYHYLNEKFDYHQRVYNIHNFNSKLEGKFFYYYFSEHFYKRVMAMSAKGSVDSVRMEMIADMKFPLPPVNEQLKIVNILSSCDEEIQSLKDLLEAIKLQKKGLMQQLLTGKIRVKV